MRIPHWWECSLRPHGCTPKVLPSWNAFRSRHNRKPCCTHPALATWTAWWKCWTVPECIFLSCTKTDSTRCFFSVHISPSFYDSWAAEVFFFFFFLVSKSEGCSTRQAFSLGVLFGCNFSGMFPEMLQYQVRTRGMNFRTLEWQSSWDVPEISKFRTAAFHFKKLKFFSAIDLLGDTHLLG